MTTPPTVAQLRNIADRADRGPLTPDEVARLRQGIDGFDRRRGKRPSVAWSNKVAALRRKLHALHAPMIRGGMQICTNCSGWNGSYCVGAVTEWPCDTITAFDTTFPIKENAA